VTVAAKIREKLAAGLTPIRLAVHDDSRRHAGHAGASPKGESHFRIEVVSARFAGQDRVARQRLVYGLLADELRAGVHALQLITLTPEEDARRTGKSSIQS
jgi:BolA family transcriptional regulator, general stress-responsive regulator